jgi:hypothetical protein
MATVKAELVALDDRKYYGTEIDLGANGLINVWLFTKTQDEQRPSQRQLDNWGVATPEEAGEDGYLDDSHYETDITFKVASVIVDAINKNFAIAL